MRRELLCLVVVSLLVGPALRADDAGKPAEPQDEALPEGAPKLPDGSVTDALPDSSTAEETGELEASQGIPARPGKPRPDLKPEHFLWGNFFLGALGGGLLGAAVGIVASDGTSQGIANAGSIGGGIGLVGGGLLSILLGATTPVPPVPPKVNASLGPPMLAWTLYF